MNDLFPLPKIGKKQVYSRLKLALAAADTVP
jgi:hypothetical protein